MEYTGILLCLVLMFIINTKTSLISTKMDLCGPIVELILDQYDESAAIITLASNEYSTTCKLKIIAPETHVVNLNIIDTVPNIHRDYIMETKSDTCHLNVYQNENADSVWTGDPCSNQPLADIDLLHPDVTLVWNPPANSSHTKGRKLLVTAVGRGDTCKDSLQHTCMSIGHEPLFCVSKYLVCDGNHNCPKGATKSDEDDKMCKITLSMFFKQFKNSEVNDKIINLLLSKTTKSPKVQPVWRDWTSVHKLEVTTTVLPTTTQSSNLESISVTLSHYGPWGYILLGMLICGTVLMFCGVWECFRKPKPPAEAMQTTPTTVLIINQQEENNPPRYDDIDPPSYSALFPNIKLNESVVQQTDVNTETSERNAPESNGQVEVVNQSNSQVASATNVSAELQGSINFNDVQTDSYTNFPTSDSEVSSSV